MIEKNFERIFQKVKEIVEVYHTEASKFYEKHLLTSKDEITLVLKSHLYLESAIDKIIYLVSPRPNDLLKISFSDKVKILNSFNFTSIDSVIINKIKVINSIRNSFSHNLEYALTREDIAKLTGKDETGNNFLMKSFLGEIGRIQGSLEAGIVVTEIFPFLMSSFRNQELFKNDKKFNLKILTDSYEEDGFSEVLMSLMSRYKLLKSKKKI